MDAHSKPDPGQSAHASGRSFRRWRRLDAHHRLVMGVLFGAAVALFLSLPGPVQLPESLRVLLAWDSGVLAFLVLTFVALRHYDHGHLRLSVQAQDGNRSMLLLLVTAAAGMSLVVIAVLLRHTKSLPPAEQILQVLCGLWALISSWLLLHTIFATHYACRYYREYPATPGQAAGGGLLFPGTAQPDYWDFWYFSVVVGATAQVSDVQITSSSMRRLCILHGCLSFFFNTFILALSINIVASLV